MTPETFALPDSAARERIREDVDSNLAVEAAAGSGKTTCLVERLLTLARRGLIAPGNLVAAVTFTRKAAAELRERLSKRLADAVAAADERDRTTLEAAAQAIRQSHIGTIHSFCGRLLRERPVEAGVDPAFAELEQDEDEALRDKAWDLFVQRLDAGAWPDLEAALPELDLSPEDLRPGFSRYATYPDVDVWPGLDASTALPDASRLIAELAGFLEQTPSPPAGEELDPGRDGLMPIHAAMRSWLRRWRAATAAGSIPDPAGFFALLNSLAAKPSLVQKAWEPLFGAEYGMRSKEELDRYKRFHAEAVKPYLDRLRSARYAAALRSFREAKAIHDELRRHAGGLNFQDLLLRTIALLRDHPLAREDIAGRYRRLLVDEVQDTDPLQAEILFLLTASDCGERDWRRAIPRPGSLFVVGDPKQSIYRFARADIASYAAIKRRILDTGGEVLSLSANFRSHPRLIDWVNQTFGPAGSEEEEARFPAAETDVGPAYVPLQAAARGAEGDCFSGVFSLTCLQQRRKAKDDAPAINAAAVRDDEAARIAAFVRHAVDAPLMLANRDGSSRPAAPDDFLVMTWEKSGLAPIAEHMLRLGVPCRVDGPGDDRPDSPVRLFLLWLRAALNADDEVAFLACLKSRLWGVSDAELYAWVEAGGGFSRLREYPAAKAAADSPVAEAFALLEQHQRLARDCPPLEAARRMAEDLGIWALAGLGEKGDSEAGRLATLFDALATVPGGFASAADLADRLEAWLDGGGPAAVPALGENGGKVRLMNLHKTKGLEAPVVFLAGGRSGAGHKVGVHIDRAGEKVTGYMALYRQSSLLACPPGWEAMETAENRFAGAERVRLRYVAATRAGQALVISLRPTSKGVNCDFVAKPNDETPLPEPGGGIAEGMAVRAAPAGEINLDPDALSRFAGDVADKLARAVVPTYAVGRAKSGGEGFAPTVAAMESDAAPDRDKNYLLPDLDAEEAALLGEAMHQLLDTLPLNSSPAETEALAAELLRRKDLDATLARAVAASATAVFASPVWKRALGADRIFKELPFTMAAPSTGFEGGELVRGVIDLAFKEKDGWVVVDYKTDSLKGKNPARAAERHRGQMENYARALRLADPAARIKELGIYFVKTGDYVILEPSDGQS